MQRSSSGKVSAKARQVQKTAQSPRSLEVGNISLKAKRHRLRLKDPFKGGKGLGSGSSMVLWNKDARRCLKNAKGVVQHLSLSNSK